MDTVKYATENTCNAHQQDGRTKTNVRFQFNMRYFFLEWSQSPCFFRSRIFVRCLSIVSLFPPYIFDVDCYSATSECGSRNIECTFRELTERQWCHWQRWVIFAGEGIQFAGVWIRATGGTFKFGEGTSWNAENRVSAKAIGTVCRCLLVPTLILLFCLFLFFCCCCCTLHNINV